MCLACLRTTEVHPPQSPQIMKKKNYFVREPHQLHVFSSPALLRIPPTVTTSHDLLSLSPKECCRTWPHVLNRYTLQKVLEENEPDQRGGRERGAFHFALIFTSNNFVLWGKKVWGPSPV
jgi:hypothetical protein